ncbi:MAG: hypothetical protein P0Y53_10060 [Candidatus Pseudobacter hemicellulosilyticus]|uniref:Uncharacterized protein n=1 Tax=Candidatus Pseudobacter hemicellulosilyticus TaxID=3121375 RepID=A0AAJ5WVB9_9BACT|nr:MAG: hypothetical protein P0Y53_10060 [Pseudobacter sp.]
MKSDNEFEQLLAALQENKPALNAADAAALTSAITAGIASKKQAGIPPGKLLSIARVLSGAAAVLLLCLFFYEETITPGSRQPGIVYTTYYNETASSRDSVPQTDSIKFLLDYYRQQKKGKSAFTLFKEQYTSLAKK